MQKLCETAQSLEYDDSKATRSDFKEVSYVVQNSKPSPDFTVLPKTDLWRLFFIFGRKKQFLYR